MGVTAFRRRVEDVLLPRFCEQPERSTYTAVGYQGEWGKISDADAEDCLLAIDSNIVIDRGYYFSTRRGRNKELLFHEVGAKDPRPIRMAHETIITFAALARLHFEFGWPQDLLGGESPCGAFDARAFARVEDENELIACEIKSSSKELEKLIRLMLQFASEPDRVPTSSQTNAYRKVIALRNHRAELFWAVGPNRENTVFALSYQTQGIINFAETSSAALRYSAR